MTKQELLDQIRQARAELLAAINDLSADAMLRPGVVGLWSVKDLLAHVTVWQSELITALAGLGRPGNTPHIVKIEDLDEFNAEQYHINASRGLDIILEDFHGVHKHLIRAVEGIDEKTLNNARRFPWMEGEPLTYLIAENGNWHEQEHARQIAEWRKTQRI
jgi:uncharacterized damage-inducible protein DinB